MSASACSARGHQQQVDRIVIDFRWLSRVALANPQVGQRGPDAIDFLANGSARQTEDCRTPDAVNRSCVTACAQTSIPAASLQWHACAHPAPTTRSAKRWPLPAGVSQGKTG